MAANRKPWLAALLNLLAAGLGHLYAGRPRQGLLWFVSAMLCFALYPRLILSLPHGRTAALLAWAVPFGGLAALAISGARAARAAAVPFLPTRLNRWEVYTGFWIVAVIIFQQLTHPAMQAQYQAFRVVADAMAPTIQQGDHLYASKLDLPKPLPERGTLIVFRSVTEPGLQVFKRVVGLPGDTLAMQNGDLFVNGLPVDEPYLAPFPEVWSAPEPARNSMLTWQREHLLSSVAADYLPDVFTWGPIIVPPSSLFVLGDNRSTSYDSRFYGFVPASHITAIPRLIYYSYDPNSSRPLPALTAVRWSRIGRRPN